VNLTPRFIFRTNFKTYDTVTNTPTTRNIWYRSLPIFTAKRISSPAQQTACGCVPGWLLWLQFKRSALPINRPASVLARENQCFPREPTSCHWIRILGTSTPSKPEADPIQGFDRARNRYAWEGKGLCRVFDTNETSTQAIVAISHRTLLTNVQFSLIIV